MKMPTTSIDATYTTVTQIRYPDVSGHATGFFFHCDEEQYIITNRHAIDFKYDDGSQLTEIKIFTRTSLRDLNHYKINLIEDGETSWYVHPDAPQIDIIAIPLNNIVDENEIIPLEENRGSETIFSNSFSEEHFRPDNVLIEAGQQAVIIGYPIQGQKPYYPLGRSALVASPYGTAFNKIPGFATDANMHQGTSGSPVLYFPNGMEIKMKRGLSLPTRRFYLLGIHSNNLNHYINQQELISEGPLNLNIAWYAELIPEICRERNTVEVV